MENIDMNPREIRKKIKKRGGVSALARELGVKHPAVYQVINDDRPNPRIRTAISEKIGIPEGELWPKKAAEVSEAE